jgi:hypothetical protein
MPDVFDVLDADLDMKAALSGRKRKRKPRPGEQPMQPMMLAPPEDQSIPIAQRMEIARTQAAEVHKNTKHITTQPLFVQQSFAMRNKSMDELFPPKKGK